MPERRNLVNSWELAAGSGEPDKAGEEPGWGDPEVRENPAGVESETRIS